MRILKEAGLPDGVINLVYVDGPTLGKVCFNHRDFAGVHFTGSTGVFNNMWETIGENIGNVQDLIRALLVKPAVRILCLPIKALIRMWWLQHCVRGAFEYQGQKCSAASRAYIPSNLAEEVKKKLIAGVKSL